MSFIHFNEEQIAQAKSADLSEFLRSRGETIKRSGSEWEWKHNGAKITIRRNKWYHQYEQVGGTAIDFVQRFHDMDFMEAMQKLLGYNVGSVIQVTALHEDNKPFALPEPSRDMRRVFAYLMKQRFIDRNIIAFFAHNKMLYEDADFHNAVFVGYNENGVARHAHKRGTFRGNSYKGNVDGSLSEYSFHYIGTSNRLYVFEAPVDMLSYISLYPKDWQQHSYVALCSVAEHAAIHLLKQNTYINEIYLCLDHDKAGMEGSYRIADSINALNPEYMIKQLIPNQKDWNEQLKQQNGTESQPGIEHPNMKYVRDLCHKLGKEKLRLNSHLRFVFDDLKEMLDRLKKLNPHNIAGIQEQAFDISRLALTFCVVRHRQIGVKLTTDWYIDRMFELYKPHRDNGGYKSRIGDIGYKLQSIIHDYGEDRIYTKTECETQIVRALELGLDCLRLNAYVSLQTQEQTQAPQLSIT